MKDGIAGAFSDYWGRKKTRLMILFVTVWIRKVITNTTLLIALADIGRLECNINEAAVFDHERAFSFGQGSESTVEFIHHLAG